MDFSNGMALKAKKRKDYKTLQSLLLPTAVRLGVMPCDPPPCKLWGFLLNAKLAEILAVDKLASLFVISVKTALLCNRCGQPVRLQANA